MPTLLSLLVLVVSSTAPLVLQALEGLPRLFTLIFDGLWVKFMARLDRNAGFNYRFN